MQGLQKTSNGHHEILYRAVDRFGIPAVLLFFVLWWARTDIVQPLLDAHFDFISKITTAHEQHTQQLETLSRKLDTLIDVQREK